MFSHWKLLARPALLLALLGKLVAGQFAAAGELEIKIVDGATGEPIAARLTLRDARGRLPRVPQLPRWQDQTIIDGAATLKLPTGRYTFDIDRGLEYRSQSGRFEIEPAAKDAHTIVMKRFVDMRKEGWWSGDLQVARAPAEMPLVLRSEDLAVANVVTWSTEQNPWLGKALPDPARVRVGLHHWYDLLGGHDRGGGGGLLLAGLAAPPKLLRSPDHAPSSMLYLNAAHARGAFTAAATPFALDLPLWAASGNLDSVLLAHSHYWPHGMLTADTGYPRDRFRYPDPHGVGRWSTDIHHHLLNVGLRIPPAAGSGSGEVASPAGYNRVYVHCGDDFTWEAWWNGLRAGRVVVTNGPMLRPLCEGELPGHIFRGYQGEKLTLQLTANLATRDPVDYFEIVQNGAVVQEVRLDKWAEEGGSLPPLEFTESGWFLVRVVTSEPKTYRFASSGPYYVDFGRPRISRRSVQFFVDWVEHLRGKATLAPAAQQAALLAEIDSAAAWWKKRLEEANAP